MNFLKLHFLYCWRLRTELQYTHIIYLYKYVCKCENPKYNIVTFGSHIDYVKRGNRQPHDVIWFVVECDGSRLKTQSSNLEQRTIAKNVIEGSGSYRGVSEDLKRCDSELEDGVLFSCCSGVVSGPSKVTGADGSNS